MQFNTLLATFALIVSVLAADTESWTVLNNAAQSRGVNMAAGTTYMFYELWAPKGEVEDCVSGYAHVMLVVGTPADTGDGMDFHGEAFDLGIVGQLPAQGKEVFVERTENWRANQYQTSDGSWRHVSTNNVYEYQGVTTTANNIIQSRGDQYQRDHPIYQTRDTRQTPANNCRTYVDYLVSQVKSGNSKRNLGQSLHTRFIESLRVAEVAA